MLKKSIQITVGEIAEAVEGTLRGDPTVTIRGIEGLDGAAPDDITFLSRRELARRWQKSRAAAIVVTRGLLDEPDPAGRPSIEVADAEHAASLILEMFQRPEQSPDEGVHPGAQVHPDAQLDQGVRIGPGASVGAGCRIGEGTIVHPGVHMYARVEVGRGCTLHSGVVLREGIRLGDRVTLHPGVVIGSDGFGYRPDRSTGGLRKVPHIGTVLVDDDVEIGANTCIDRAKFGATVIGRGTKIDNLCQIGHNCRIGRSCVIAGLVGFGGSVTLGDGVMVGGASSFTDHISVGAGARIGGRSGVTRNVPPGEEWLGLPAGPARETLRQWASVRRLPSSLAQQRGVPPRGK